MVLICLSIAALIAMFFKVYLSWRVTRVQERLGDFAMMSFCFTAAAAYTVRFFKNWPGDFAIYFATFPILFTLLYAAVYLREVGGGQETRRQ